MGSSDTTVAIGPLGAKEYRKLLVDVNGNLLVAPSPQSAPQHGTISVPFTAVVLSTVSTTILAANANRKSAVIFNTSGKAMYLHLGAAAVANRGIRLADNEGYYIGANNLWTGTVTGIVSVGAGSCEKFEGVV